MASPPLRRDREPPGPELALARCPRWAPPSSPCKNAPAFWPSIAEPAPPAQSGVDAKIPPGHNDRQRRPRQLARIMAMGVTTLDAGTCCWPHRLTDRHEKMAPARETSGKR